METRTVPGPSASLDRHQLRREAGLAIVSVLSGPPGLAVREGRLWAGRRGRAVVEVADHRPDAVVNAWADSLAAGGELRREVVSRLACRLGEDVDDLGPRIARMTPTELGLLLGSASPDRDGEGVEAACRWVLEREADRPGQAEPGLANRLGAALPGPVGDGPSGRAFVALGALIPAGRGPVILAARGPGGAESPAWFEAASTSIARLVLAQPRVSAILAVDPVALESYLRHAPESREKALIRSGVVEVPGLDEGEAGPRLAASPPDAASVREGPDGPGSEDRARSAAERFLFERLESLPATAGLFELNSTLDIPFGPGRSMEVDLASQALGLAIEVDGYYHFRDEAAYRRDRRKDVLLQDHGYLVVRILAEDVVRRLEDVLDLILQAVASRRRDRNAPNRDAPP